MAACHFLKFTSDLEQQFQVVIQSVFGFFTLANYQRLLLSFWRMLWAGISLMPYHYHLMWCSLVEVWTVIFWVTWGKKREGEKKWNASLTVEQLSVTANHARRTSNMKSDYIEVKLLQHGNFAAALVLRSQTPWNMTMWLLFISSTRRQGRAPLCLNPPNEEMHYDVISFGSCRKAAVDNRAVWVAWFICVVTCDLCFRES